MKKVSRHRRPVSLVLIMNLMAFLLLYLYKGAFDKYILMIGIPAIAVIYLTYLIISKREMGDEYLFLIVSMLVSLGMIMIYRLDRNFGLKQLIWFGGGMILFFLSYIIYMKIDRWDKLIYIYIASSFILFLVTLILGKNIQGATNWIVIAGHSFQPSEFIKLLFIFFLACYFNNPSYLQLQPLKIKNRTFSIHHKLLFMITAYAYMGFLVLQKEWGTTLLIFGIYFMTIYVFDRDIRFMAVNLALAIAGATGGVLFAYHIKVRISTWLNPWADIAGKGYQITQSLFAIGSGGFFGTGIGLGNPEFIPNVYTDFIFSAICEECGILGGVAVILLYFLLVYRGIKIALTIKNTFHKTVALGITLMFGFQTFIIIGGVIKLIPLTGITLPFISYGGSSLTTSFIALGILQAVSKKSQEESEEIVDGE